ncbi:hypothetical protein [Streptomyces sp. NPDC001401]|uniref:hypothetical protein n=1 Tax=Streptomyces sp. NPDC001401 TaxID=3364570 RepID=UPI00369C1E72
MPGEPDARRLRDVRLHGGAVDGQLLPSRPKGMPVTSRRLRGCGTACFGALMPQDEKVPPRR